MPVVFSPGEGETRPLDPTATVYTTPQKVAVIVKVVPLTVATSLASIVTRLALAPASGRATELVAVGVTAAKSMLDKSELKSISSGPAPDVYVPVIIILSPKYVGLLSIVFAIIIHLLLLILQDCLLPSLLFLRLRQDS